MKYKKIKSFKTNPPKDRKLTNKDFADLTDKQMKKLGCIDHGPIKNTLPSWLCNLLSKDAYVIRIAIRIDKQKHINQDEILTPELVAYALLPNDV